MPLPVAGAHMNVAREGIPFILIAAALAAGASAWR